jgi:RNA polymerase sigma-70 factor, ECF subfamily
MIAFDPTFDESSLDPDTELMIRVSAGDQQAFEELLEKHLAATVRIISAMMGSRAQADDLAQEVFWRIYRARTTYLPTAKFSSWLGMIIRNAVLNAKRGQARQSECLNKFFQEVVADKWAVVSDPALDCDRGELIESVALAVRNLPERQRTAMELVHFQGKSYAGAAKEMQTTAKAVKSLLGRGRGTLAGKLQATEQQYARV